MIKAYRIMTEDKNRPELTALVTSRFDCFTIYHGVGYWRGNAEGSLTIEIIDVRGDISYEQIASLAKSIKRLNKQEAVLVTVSELQGELI